MGSGRGLSAYQGCWRWRWCAGVHARPPHPHLGEAGHAGSAAGAKVRDVAGAAGRRSPAAPPASRCARFAGLGQGIRSVQQQVFWATTCCRGWLRREGHSAALIGDRMYIFGGNTGAQVRWGRGLGQAGWGPPGTQALVQPQDGALCGTLRGVALPLTQADGGWGPAEQRTNLASAVAGHCPCASLTRPCTAPYCWEKGEDMYLNDLHYLDLRTLTWAR